MQSATITTKGTEGLVVINPSHIGVSAVTESMITI